MERISLSARGPIARLRLGPRRRVPLLDSVALWEIGEALQEAVARGCRALIVAGGSEGIFAAGADLNEVARLDPLGALDFAERGQKLLGRIEAAPLVAIAAIRGRCIGGAFDLAMACDLRLAEEGAAFSHPGPRVGFITGYGGTSRLPLLAGPVAGGVLAGRVELDVRGALSRRPCGGCAARPAGGASSSGLRPFSGAEDEIAMQVLLFELAGGTYALKLQAVERILAPGDPLPGGRRPIDLAGLLGLSGPRQAHLVLLAGRGEALRIGRPLGTARIDPAWILPLPGYMFRVQEAPFRGLIEIPAGGRPGRPAVLLARGSLLLDEERLARGSG